MSRWPTECRHRVARATSSSSDCRDGDGAGVEHERRLRRESRAGDGDAECSGVVAGRESLDVAHIQNLCARSGRSELARLGLRADERAAVHLHDAFHVRRPRCRGTGGLGDEERDVVVCQRWIEAPLEADRRRRLRAHRLPAQRAGDVSRIHLDAVSELDEPSERVEEAFRALARLDREVGPRSISDEE